MELKKLIFKNSIQFNSIQFNSIQFNSIQFNSISSNLNFCLASLFFNAYYVYLLGILLLNNFSTFIISFYKFFNLVIGVLSLNACYKKNIFNGGFLL